MKIFFNGRYYADNKPLVKIFDRGLVFGDGIFTTLKVEDSIPLFLNHHSTRLKSSCQFFGITFPDLDFSAIIPRLLQHNELKNARVKIMVTRGYDVTNRIYNYEGEPSNIVILAFPLPSQPLKPKCLCLSPELRGNESIYRHKTISYLSNLTRKTIAQKNGFDDAIMLNSNKELLETTTANIFFVVKDKIITPPKELPLLNGIMRQTLLALGSIGKYRLLEDSLTRKDLKKAEGCFLTSAVLEICPVIRIEDKKNSLEKPKAIQKEWLRLRRSGLQKIGSSC